ncbi:unnamed protein product [Protopolystoma xenopodis]|uniref:Uncharacterized protein n=1 Tax=Protopolystoma xenopodis TaxID=117903 RepID=A0A3S5FG68_9PLAT|nr:unnamed protein product [Protopolystoma xenopodis]
MDRSIDTLCRLLARGSPGILAEECSLHPFRWILARMVTRRHVLLTAIIMNLIANAFNDVPEQLPFSALR